MKLYATITSERATKGQGGEYLDIEIFTTSKDEPSHKIEVRQNYGKIDIILHRKHFGKWYNSKDIDTIYINESKGEKKKGDKWDCTHTPLCDKNDKSFCKDNIPL